MNIRKKQIKKLPHLLSILLLTGGASLVLGFLSFGGMYVLVSAIPLAVAAFGLSVAYESEIYFQNIKSAFKKILNNNYFKRQVAKQYLAEHFPETQEENCPQFFKDYEAQFKLLEPFEHKRLDKKSKVRKKQIEKTLRTMEKWFSVQFFRLADDDLNDTPYAKALQIWLQNHAQIKWRRQFSRKNYLFQAAKLFSIFSGFMTGVGTTYLLVEAFTTIPLLASIPFGVLPIIVIPMAIVAGIAYGVLTYNAVTDMIANDTLKKWYQIIRDDLSKNFGLRSVLMTGVAVFLVALAITLTICTAGTWWTIAKSARPLFSWMGKIPPVLMTLVGIDSIAFNIVNTFASWLMIHDATKPRHTHCHHDHHDHHDHHEENAKPNMFKRGLNILQKRYQALRQEENWLQILNPFRIGLRLVMLPARLILFLGHLISMGVGDDRVPGVPETLSAGLSTTSEIFEDLHYFFDLAGHHHHQHSAKDYLKEQVVSGHDHSHDNDLPTRALNAVCSPVYLVSATWDYLASQFNQTPISFHRAWERQWGLKPQDHVDTPTLAPDVSPSWKVANALYKIERHQDKQLKKAWFNQDLAKEKFTLLNRLKNKIKTHPEQIAQTLEADLKENSSIYGKHRLFDDGEQTSTIMKLENISLSCR